MSVVLTTEVIHQGAKLLDCEIRKGMKLSEILAVISKRFELIGKQIDLSGIDIEGLGLDDCDFKGKSPITEIINKLITDNTALQETLKEILEEVQTVTESISQETDTDERVKVNEADATAGYLADKITATQKGSAKVEGDQLVLSGFAPVGSVFYIDKSRLSDFDGTGKGKADTDVWGYAISNGGNGTRNRLGLIMKNAADINDAGNKVGSDTVKLTISNIPTIQLPITGTIAESLTAPIKAEFKLNTNKMSDGAGGSTHLLRLGDGISGSNLIKSLDLSVRHSHTHNLSAKYDNPNVTSINTIPASILEIPIQRIF